MVTFCNGLQGHGCIKRAPFGSVKVEAQSDLGDISTGIAGTLLVCKRLILQWDVVRGTDIMFHIVQLAPLGMVGMTAFCKGLRSQQCRFACSLGTPKTLSLSKQGPFLKSSMSIPLVQIHGETPHFLRPYHMIYPSTEIGSAT